MKKRKKKVLSGKPMRLFWGLVIFVVALGVIGRLTDMTQQIKRISYSEFLQDIEKDQVKSVEIAGTQASGLFADGTHFEAVVPAGYSKHWDLLHTHNVKFDSKKEPAGPMNLWMILTLLSFLLIPAVIWYFFRQMNQSNGSGGSGVFSIIKSRAKMIMPATIKENFNSVAGAVEAKEELADVIDYLRNPERYKRLGAQITRGILLIGQPGNGKTLLARAVAGEANCPFFSISGSDFMELFVGVGASRVRDLFVQARKQAPCIIFIDEIDAVGRHRGSGQGGGHDEREQTLNQLLTEMDGFEVSPQPVIVLAATNRPDVLDKALLRPGRFGRQVEVPVPDLKCREEILKVHMKNVTLDPEIDLHKIARGTPGFSGADLANLVNEAAINATKNDQKHIAMHDFEEARDKVTLGKESKTKVISEDERKVISWHESGHALVRLLTPDHSEPLHKVTIIPRGLALGVTHFIPEKEKYLRSKQEMISSIKTALGGRIAEELEFNTLTTGASSDFKAATEIARSMVCSYGMSDEMGKIIYSQSYGDFVYSQKTAEQIDAVVKKIIDDCYQDTKKLLIDNRDKLDTLARELLEKETMYASEVYQLLGIQAREDHKLS